MAEHAHDPQVLPGAAESRGATRGEIVAPAGRPLAAALVSVGSLEAALGFWRDRLGFEPLAEVQATDAEFDRLCGLREGRGGRALLLRACGMPVGQLLLVEWPGAGRPIRDEPGTRAFGLQNLNFYVRDAAEAAAALAAAGCEPWSPPTAHAFATGGVGAPVEVILEGPDAVALNLVELATADPATRIGQMRAYVARTGRTRPGYTPVVTTSHVVRATDAAVRFHAEVLGMGVLFEDVLASPAANRFLRLPPEAHTRVTFLQGGHMYGKVALSEPLDYACEELAPRAHAPNRGYLAQVFEVDSIDEARRACRDLGVAIAATAERVDVPGFGERAALAVRAPGSDAPVLLLSE